MSSGNLEGDIVTAFKRSWQKLLLAKSAKRPDKAMIFSKIKTINKLHRQLRLRSVYPFLFENHLVLRSDIYFETYLFYPDINIGHFITGPTCNKVSFSRCRTLIIH